VDDEKRGEREVGEGRTVGGTAADSREEANARMGVGVIMQKAMRTITIYTGVNDTDLPRRIPRLPNL